jgi:hypothetical protein
MYLISPFPFSHHPSGLKKPEKPAHTYNPSHSGGRDQEDCGLKQAQVNSSQDPILKKPITEKKGVGGWWSGSRCRPEFKPQYQEKKKKRPENILNSHSTLQKTDYRVQGSFGLDPLLVLRLPNRI